MIRVVAAVLALMLTPAAVLGADEGVGPGAESWREAARQALERLERALDHIEGMVERLPHYGAPYIDENGNIVIPRQDPVPLPAPGDPDSVQI